MLKEKRFTHSQFIAKFGNSKVVLQNKKNRSIELHVGRECFRFDALAKAEVPAWVPEHPDFKQESANFAIIKGEKKK